jgi:hypothetical protein
MSNFDTSCRNDCMASMLSWIPGLRDSTHVSTNKPFGEIGPAVACDSTKEKCTFVVSTFDMVM